MTAEIINLNKFRKAREKADSQHQADENRARFGRSRSDKTADTLRERARQRLLDGAHIEPGRKSRDKDADPDEAS
mgnify:CR=1 FL=1